MQKRGMPLLKIKRVAAVNDLSGFGRCSLTVAIPILSAMSVQVCPLPTAILSAHTGYKHFSFVDFAPFMDEFADNWEKLNIDFDAIYTGFLGSFAQIESVRELFTKHPEAQKIVDPVMGDDGKIYKTYTPQMCESMRALCSGADIITPNLTEACILSGRPFFEGILSEAEIRELAEQLSKLHAKNIVITGIPFEQDIVNAVLSDGGFTMDRHRRQNFSCSGTGDIFASVITGAVMKGKNFKEAVKMAGRFVSDCVDYTIKECGSFENGVIFEPLLGKLT